MVFLGNVLIPNQLSKDSRTKVEHHAVRHPMILLVIGAAVLHSVCANRRRGERHASNGHGPGRRPHTRTVTRTGFEAQVPRLPPPASRHRQVDRGRASRTGVAAAGVGARTLRDWVMRYNADGLDGLRDSARSGRPPNLEGGQAEEVASWLEAGPDPDAGGPSRWTVADIRARIADSFGVAYTLEGTRQLVRRTGFRHMSPRPVHPRADPLEREGFRRDFSRLAREAVPDGVAPEDVLVYFQDEARIGQKGMLSRVWARKGTRPRVARDHRYGYVYLFSAACPATGDAVGHVCGRANTAEMNRHLREIGERVPAGRHALVVLDGAGWHRSRDLVTPANVSLLRLPPCSPELNPVETLFSVLKHRHFANRVFGSAEHVRETVERVWDAFIRRKGEVSRIATREWAVP